MTKRMKDAHDFINQFFIENGYSPTYREIMDGIKSKSVSEVHRLVMELSDHGQLTIDPGKARSIKLLGYCERCGNVAS